MIHELGHNLGLDIVLEIYKVGGMTLIQDWIKML